MNKHRKTYIKLKKFQEFIRENAVQKWNRSFFCLLKFLSSAIMLNSTVYHSEWIWVACNSLIVDKRQKSDSWFLIIRITRKINENLTCEERIHDLLFCMSEK